MSIGQINWVFYLIQGKDVKKILQSTKEPHKLEF